MRRRQDDISTWTLFFIFYFLCGRPHGVWPLPVRMRPPEPNPLPFGRHKWMAPNPSPGLSNTDKSFSGLSVAPLIQQSQIATLNSEVLTDDETKKLKHWTQAKVGTQSSTHWLAARTLYHRGISTVKVTSPNDSSAWLWDLHKMAILVIEDLKPSVHDRPVDDYFLTTTINHYFLTTTFTTTRNDYSYSEITFSLMLKAVRLKRIRSSSRPLEQ